MTTATWRRYTLPARHTLRKSCPLQIALIVAFWGLGEASRLTLGLPVPGGIVGLFLVLVVLALFARSNFGLGELRRGARWFLAEMLLFFVPAVPAVLDHPELIGWLGLKIFAAIATGTIVVMVVTAFVVDACVRRLARPESAEQFAESEPCAESAN